MQRESMEVDVVIVGAGPAGLATAIRLKQLQPDASICVLEKGAEVGAHILSGAIMDPRAMDELLPDWQKALNTADGPAATPVSSDQFMFLSEQGSMGLPHWMLPACFANHGNFILSLGDLVRWLGQQAEALGVDIFAGFAATEVLYDDNGAVKGVATGDMGRLHDGNEGPSFQPGMELHARYTVFAEGCRGQLGKQIEERFNLREHSDPQVYGLGIKEVWEIAPDKHVPGKVTHTAGWPLDNCTYGGSWMYHYGERMLSIGFVVGLNYRNPYLSPYEEFQRFKQHPAIRPLLEGGKRLSYGARAITAGGLQALPKLAFPGGVLIGDDAGFLNASRIKGSHAAIKSGMLAAESLAAALANGRAQDELNEYAEAFKNSWLHDELHRARNFKPLMSKGLWLGSLLFGIDQTLLRGRAPWTLKLKPDHMQLLPAAQCTPIDYPKPDGIVSFDRLSSVFLSNTNHAEDQPCHLTLRNAGVPVQVNLATYAGPEQRYCPAGVYEFVADETAATPGAQRLQINAQNCVHCKTCDIKDPTQNIVWVAPQGGEGPIYQGM